MHNELNGKKTVERLDAEEMRNVSGGWDDGWWMLDFGNYDKRPAASSPNQSLAGPDLVYEHKGG